MKRKGSTVTRKGHIRITSGPHRHKYLHRRMVEVLLEETWHPFWGNELPASMDVHHIDGNKSHNEYSNFLVLDHAIHSALDKEMQRRCPFTGRYLNENEYRRMVGYKDNEPPDWVTQEFEEVA